MELHNRTLGQWLEHWRRDYTGQGMYGLFGP